MKLNTEHNVFPEISELAATGEVAQVFAELKTALQVPFVNLIWRRIAAIERALLPVWTSVKPLYEDGSIWRGMAYLDETTILPEFAGFSPMDWTKGGGGTEQHTQIKDILGTYIKANLANLVTFSAVLSLMDGREGTPSVVLLPRNAIQPNLTRGFSTVPQAIPFEKMVSDLAALVQRFNGIGADADTELRQATLPRTLAHWPEALHYLTANLEESTVEAAIPRLKQNLVEEAQRVGDVLVSAMKPLPISQEAATKLRNVLVPFLPSTLARMIVVISIVHDSL